MRKVLDWLTTWQELRANLSQQPHCPQHPEYPCVRTLSQGVINDVLEVGEQGVLARSHRTHHEDFIEAKRFETWWNHLVLHGCASLDPKAPNNPHRWRSRLVGAIMAACLPNTIKVVDSSTIELVPKEVSLRRGED